MKLSKETRKEPTQTKTLQNNYVKALLRLFIAFKKEAVSLLDRNRGLESVDEQSVQPLIDIIYTADRLRDLITIEITFPAKTIVEDHIRKSYSAGVQYSQFTLNRIGLDISLIEGPADWRIIDVLKVRNLSALKGITEETSKHIMQELTTGIQKGEGIPQLTKRIMNRVDNIGKVRAEIMARTETLYAFNQAAEQRYSQAGVEVLEWLTAEDERVCPVCGPLDEKKFRVDSNHKRPPIHPRCRCTIVPVIDIEK